MIEKDNRPLSPHLLIYRPQLTSLLSVLHRGTGAAMAVGALLLVVWLMALAAGPESYTWLAGLLGTWLGQLVLLGITMSTAYHFCNGVRHLVWDTCRCFELQAVYRGGWLVLASTVVITAVIWGVAYTVSGGA